jgi:hypothetical protein
MATDHTFGIRTGRESAMRNLFVKTFNTLACHFARVLCGMHGHQVMLRFEPNRLSLQCAMCGYATEGWEVGRPMTARRHANNLQARPDRRRTLRPLPTNARLAS